MTRLIKLCTLALVLTQAVPIAAAAPARIAALVASPDPDSKELAENLTEVLVAALAKEGSASGLVGVEEFRAQLGQSDRGILGCIGDPPCLARVGKALRVDLVLVAQVSRSVGDEYLVNANAIEVATGKVQRTLLRRPRGQKALIGAVRALGGELLRPATARLRVETNVEADIIVDGNVIGRGRMVEVRDLSPGPHKVQAKAPGMIGFEGGVELTADEVRNLGVTLTSLQTERPFYKSWWFWTSIGVAVVGGTVAGAVVTSSQEGAPPPNLGTVVFRGALNGGRR